MERKENLIKYGNETWNKWLAFTNKSWIVVNFKDVTTPIGALGFKSANDEPDRDPEKITIECFENNTWNVVHEINPDWQGERFKEIKEYLPQTCNGTKMRFTVEQDNTNIT